MRSIINMLDTPRLGWYTLRGNIIATDIALTTTTLDVGTTLPSGAVKLSKHLQEHANTPINAIQVALFANGNTGSVGYTIFAGRATGGPAIQICSGTWTLGTMDVTADPTQDKEALDITTGHYAQTVTVSDTHIKTVLVSGDQGNDRFTSLSFDLYGYDWVYFQVDALNTVTKASAIWSTI